MTQPNTSGDRRAARRFPRLFPAIVRSEGREARGTSVDVSAVGGFVQVDMLAPEGQQLEIELHVAAGSQRIPMHFEATVVRTVDRGRGPVHGIGVRWNRVRADVSAGQLRKLLYVALGMAAPEPLSPDRRPAVFDFERGAFVEAAGAAPASTSPTSQSSPRGTGAAAAQRTAASASGGQPAAATADSSRGGDEPGRGERAPAGPPLAQQPPAAPRSSARPSAAAPPVARPMGSGGLPPDWNDRLRPVHYPLCLEWDETVDAGTAIAASHHWVIVSLESATVDEGAEVLVRIPRIEDGRFGIIEVRGVVVDSEAPEEPGDHARIHLQIRLPTRGEVPALWDRWLVDATVEMALA